MKVVFKKKNYFGDIDIELEALNSIDHIEEPVYFKKVFEVDSIYEDIMNAYNGLPEKVRRLKTMMYTYWGDFSSAYDDISRSLYLRFDFREFFRTKPNEIIDEEDIDIYHEEPIYINFNKNNLRAMDSIIVEYIKSGLSSIGVNLIGCNDDTWNMPKGSEEYILNCWVPHNYPFKHNYPRINDLIDKYRSIIESAEKKYIPQYGIAETRYGEFLRACQRVVYRFFNDGDNCSHVSDGNMVSYLNLPKMIRNWIPNEAFNDLVEEFKEVANHPASEEWFCEQFYDQMDDSTIELVVQVEVALIKTREKFPDLLSEPNDVDSREWMD